MIDTLKNSKAGEAQEQETPPNGLTWGLKRSFIRYIGTLPDGGHDLSEGASLSQTSFFTFEPSPSSTFDPVTDTGTLKFTGQLRLRGHHNMLFVMIADPWIEFIEGQAILSVVDATTWPDRTKRICLALLSPSAREFFPDGSILFPSIQATLAETGTDTFGGNYSAGEELDQLFVFVPPPADRRDGNKL